MSGQINQNYLQDLGEWIQDFKSKAGVDRDNATLAKESYIDGQWLRFDNGNPRKMGGFEKILSGDQTIIRGLYAVALQDFSRIFVFRDNKISFFDVLANGSVSGEFDRTPIGWVTPPDGTASLTFSVETYTETTNNGDGTVSVTTFLFFVAPPNSESINQTVEAPIYFGPINDITPFIPLGQSTSGGIVRSGDFLLKYGNDGVIFWSMVGQPYTWPEANNQTIASQKMLAAKRYQGGLVMWTASSLERVSYDTTTNQFVGQTIADISIISPSSIVAGHNNTFYWCGNQQFYVFNGVAQTIDNGLCRNDFFTKLNRKYEGKIFGLYVGNFNEVWWFAPQGTNPECNRLYIYPYKTNAWSDSECSRTAGLQANIYKYPLLADGKFNIYSKQQVYSIWAHEKGTDAVDGENAFPIPSFYQTKLFSLFEGNPQINVEMTVRKVEKDISQTGKMYLQIYTYPYSNSTPYIYPSFEITPETSQMDIDLSGRFVSFKFISNDINGFYQSGKNMIDYKLGALRPGGTQ